MLPESREYNTKISNCRSGSFLAYPTDNNLKTSVTINFH